MISDKKARDRRAQPKQEMPAGRNEIVFKKDSSADQRYEDSRVAVSSTKSNKTPYDDVQTSDFITGDPIKIGSLEREVRRPAAVLNQNGYVTGKSGWWPDTGESILATERALPQEVLDRINQSKLAKASPQGIRFDAVGMTSKQVEQRWGQISDILKDAPAYKQQAVGGLTPEEIQDLHAAGFGDSEIRSRSLQENLTFLEAWVWSGSDPHASTPREVPAPPKKSKVQRVAEFRSDRKEWPSNEGDTPPSTRR